MKKVNGWTGIPFTSLVTVVGLILGCTYEKLGVFGKAIEAYS
jgi:hypothetical protein